MLRNLLELHIQQEATVYLQPSNFKKLHSKLRRRRLTEVVSVWRLTYLAPEVNDKRKISDFVSFKA